MNDAKYTFMQDIKEKKITARGSHNRRAHAGKGGAVKFPSDYLSKKELKAMSSETKTYKMNEPISWAEFKAMPEDLQRQYLTNLRERYNVSFTKIGEMFGVSKFLINTTARSLGIGQGGSGGIKGFDCKGWEAFIHSNAAEIPAPDETDTAEANNTADTPKNEPVAVNEFKAAIPLYGSMSFTGNATEALKTTIAILGGAAVDITISWQQPINAPLEEYRGAANNG
jgi:hypothetical protein